MRRRFTMTARLAGRVLLMLTALGSVGFITACDDDDDLTGEGEARFEAQLTPLNGSGVTGTAEFVAENGELTATVNGTGLVASIVHAQHIHAGGSCPDESADDNDDGFVDVLEGLPAYGGILVPLDGDLSDQAAGAEGFPLATASGEIAYTNSVTVTTMLDNLRGTDDDPFVELDDDEDLDLDDRTVVVHGIEPTAELPETVGSLEGLSPQATLPVACGEIDDD